MIAYNITEITVSMIRNYIKQNIAQALADVRTERNDPSVTTEPPPSESYFIYERAVGYRPPAVFIIADSVDFLKNQGPNSLNANVRVRVSVVVEDVTQYNLTIKAYRYQDALFRILDQTVLLSSNEDVKVVVVPMAASFSPVFTQDTDVKSARNTFRKEVVLECDCKHFERPQA